MKKLIFFLLIFSSNLYAWGENEQNLLKGFIGGVIIKNLIDNNRPYESYTNSRTYSFDECIDSNPYKNNLGAAKAYEKGCRQKRANAQYQLELDAYNKGLRGF